MDDAARVAAGTAVLEVRAEGYYDVSRQIEVPVGGEARETVDLVSVPTEPAHGVPPGPVPVPTPPTSMHTGSLPRTLAWVSLTGAGAGVVAGVLGLSVRAALVGTYNTDPLCPGTRSTHQGSTCQSRLDTGSAMRALEIGGFVTAGVLGVTSAVLFLVAPSRGVAPRTARGLTECLPGTGGLLGTDGLGGLGGLGVMCAGRF